MLKLERIITFVLIAGLAIAAAVNWRRANLMAADNEELRVKVEALEAEAEAYGKNSVAHAEEMETLRKRSSELMKLRNEVTQLRSSNQVAQSLAIENQRLQAEVQRRGAEIAATAQAQAQGVQQQGMQGQFPRESWQFSGYGTPENALVSAIWAMREGNSQTYLASLSPEEQQRTAANWQNMSAQQVAAKHQSDVANVTGMRVLEQQAVGPGQVLMNVYLDGANRMERVRMNQVNGEWKFSGFVREGQGDRVQPQQ